MKIYKYTSIDTGIKILIDQRILLNNPKNFNDPYDSSYSIPLKTKKYLNRLIFNYALFKKYTTSKHDTKLKRKVNKLLMEKNRIINSKFPKYKFNETVDSIRKQEEREKPLIRLVSDKIEDDVINHVENNLDDIMKRICISCFSERNDSMLMWSHYADSHQGICFEYEVNDNNFKKVQYSLKRPKNDLRNLYRIIIGHIIANKKVDCKNDFVKDPIFKILLTKSKEWEYEKEVRCIFFDNDKNIIKDNDNNFYKIGKPTKIYIGCKKLKSEKLNFLLNIARQWNIPVEVMTTEEDTYNIVSLKDKSNIEELYIHDNISNDNIHLLLHEMEFSLKSRNFTSALLISFLIIAICANSEFNDESYKIRQNKWYEKYLKQYINLDVVIFYAIKEALINNGTSHINKQFGDYLYTHINFEFCSDSVLFQFSPSHERLIEKTKDISLNINYLCTKLITIVKEILTKEEIRDSINFIDIDLIDAKQKIRKNKEKNRIASL